MNFKSRQFEPPNPSPMSKLIEEIIKRYKTRICDDSVFFAPDIPERKLRNAVEGYARAGGGERALALIDNSFFGSAKDGVLLTRERIYSSEWSDVTFALDLSAIESVEFVETDSAKEIHLNNAKFVVLHMADAQSVRTFTEMLDEIRRVFHPTDAEFQTRKPRTGKCATCGAPFRLTRLYANCSYCGSYCEEN